MWILEHCIWEDIGIWDDTDFWCDSPSTAVSGTLDATEAPDVASLTGTVQAAPEPPPLGGGAARKPRRPEPVEGFGDGILPPLEGEAFGVVGAAGQAAARLPDLGILAVGAAGASGSSQARLAINAAASGDCGSTGRAIGHIANIKAVGIAHHDDDEAVVIGFLLDA